MAANTGNTGVSVNKEKKLRFYGTSGEEAPTINPIRGPLLVVSLCQKQMSEKIAEDATIRSKSGTYLL
jgi:hypothetical protein